MPDITMCVNETCPLRERCYRFRATPSEMQSFTKFSPDGDKCDHFVRLITRHEAALLVKRLDRRKKGGS